MAVNFLHIWPRQTFMLIALPNQVSRYMQQNQYTVEALHTDDHEEKGK